MNDVSAKSCSQETTLATCQQYQALLAVAEAIVAHRDLNALIHDLAGLCAKSFASMVSAWSGMMLKTT